MYWTMFLLADGSKAVSGSMPKAFSGDALPQIYGNLGPFRGPRRRQLPRLDIRWLAHARYLQHRPVRRS